MLWHLGGLAGLGETVCPSPKGSIFLETASKSGTWAFHIQTNIQSPPSMPTCFFNPHTSQGPQALSPQPDNSTTRGTWVPEPTGMTQTC